VTFIKYAAYHLQQLGLKRQLRASEEKEAEKEAEAEKCPNAVNGDRCPASVEYLNKLDELEKAEEAEKEEPESVSDEDKQFVQSITEGLGKDKKPVEARSEHICLFFDNKYLV
jgi:hypothetical protein